MSDVTIIFAFIAGLVSFLSPCVLPIIPGFLAYLAGSSLEPPSTDSTSSPQAGSGQAGQTKRWPIFLHSLLFVLGFAAVFSALGVLLNTVLEAIAYDVQTWLARIGGAIIIFFGLYLVGLVRIPFLEREFKPRVDTSVKRSRYATSFLFGAAFAAGWTPCVGAVLGSILALAAVKAGSALTLLFSYSIGLGIPFLIVGAFAAQASNAIARWGKWLTVISKVFGVVLIILGILAFTQQLNRIANLELLNRILLQ